MSNLQQEFMDTNDEFVNKLVNIHLKDIKNKVSQKDRDDHIKILIKEKSKIADNVGLGRFDEEYYQNQFQLKLREQAEKNNPLLSTRQVRMEGGLLENDDTRYQYKHGGSHPLGDLNDDGELSGYEENRQNAIEENMRKQKQEGGQIDDQMSMLMNDQNNQEEMSTDEQMSMLMDNEQEPPMESDDVMEDNYLDFIIDEALTEEEEDMLMSKLEQDEQLSMLFDKVIEVASEFAGSGPVEGPGSGVSDSIPARLSDGEFVFTAKSVEEIGADELMRMMKDAEMRADERQGMANGGEMDEEENVVVRDVDEPVTQNINVTKTTVDSPAKSMEDEDEITKNIRTNMMMRKSPDHVRS